MSTTLNTSSLQIAKASANARRSVFNKVDWNKDATVSFSLPKQVDTPNVTSYNVINTVEGIRGMSLNLSPYNFDGSFHNRSLEQLRIDYNIPAFEDGKWIADITEEQGRITMRNCF